MIKRSLKEKLKEDQKSRKSKNQFLLNEKQQITPANAGDRSHKTNRPKKVERGA